MTAPSPLSRDQIATLYFEQLPYPPYPVQEEAILTWFTAPHGLLVCAPTGTGKTLIAETALFEALHGGKRAYYTTPLIALTEQKLRELQDAVARWGFSPNQVGLVTGNRRVNPDAPLLVVVAEILFNRLLHRDQFDFADVDVVVMDEFHNFNDPERGMVWELSLGLLPEHVRLLLLSATVGNAYEFTSWLRRSHGRSIELVQSDERKVPLTYHWIGDMLLTEQIEIMAAGEEVARNTPALIFCFNRDECWEIAEQLKGKNLIDGTRQKTLGRELEAHDWSAGAGPKLKQLLYRGVGVHHAGVLPKYRRVVEELFQRKLLSVCVCTETLAAGINLPARSVVIPNLLKGPPGERKLIDPSSAHQMFGRAGRPQFDTQGHVFALAHEDDVKLLRWREKYDQIPEDTKDPKLRQAKKALKKKMPTRRTTEQYWSEGQFEQLKNAAPNKMASRGPLPWRLLIYMLSISPEVRLIRELVGKRLMDAKRLDGSQKLLEHMLRTLAAAGHVTLDPPPPKEDSAAAPLTAPQPTATAPAVRPLIARSVSPLAAASPLSSPNAEPDAAAGPPAYRPDFAHPTASLTRLLVFRSVNPLYGDFLARHLGIADRAERLQALESVLEMPATVSRLLRVPKHDELPPGPLATTWLDPELLQLGLASPEQLGAVTESPDEEEERRREMFPEERVWVLTLAEKLRLLFDHDFPGVGQLKTGPVWGAGEVLGYGDDFNKLVTSRGLQKQEGVLFRHLLRMILLLAEFQQVAPNGADPDAWCDDLSEVADRLISCCRRVDPTSTDQTLEQLAQSTSDDPRSAIDWY